MSGLLLVGPTKPGTRVRVTPQVGTAPAEITVLAFRSPDPTDRAWRITLEQDGFEDPLMTSETSVAGLDGDLVKRLHWGPLAEGTYTVVSCVAPRAACARVPVVISGPTP